MIYAILLLGLLPLAMLPGNDIPATNEDGPDAGEDEKTAPSEDLLDPPDEGDEGLDPTIEDDEPPEPDQPVVEGLDPTIDDDKASDPGIDPEIGLDPTIEDDSPGDTAEIFEVAGFDTERDCLNIVMAEADWDDVGDISVEPNADGNDSEVYIGQVLVAVFKGVPDATEDHVVIEYE